MSNLCLQSEPLSVEVYQDRWQQDTESIIFFPLAKAYLNAGQTAEAIEVCQHGLSRHPYYWGARVILAKAYLKVGKVQEAKEELEKVVNVVPNNILAATLLAKIYEQEEEVARAIRCYRIINAFYPERKDVLERINSLMEVDVPRKKKVIRALEDYRDVIRGFYGIDKEKAGR